VDGCEEIEEGTVQLHVWVSIIVLIGAQVKGNSFGLRTGCCRCHVSELNAEGGWQ
jgi:hypothetical protein